jgi:hypothetical protein
MTFIDFVSKTWVEVNTKNFSSDTKRLEDNSKLGIGVKTPRFLASIEVWERAWCLDIVILPLDSKSNGTLLYAGSCESFEEAKTRLVEFYKQLN